MTKKVDSSIDIEKLIKTMHPLERKVLKALKAFVNGGKSAFFFDLVKESKLKDIEVMRSLQWLANKELLKIDETIEEVVDLDKNGCIYKEKGLPERNFLNAVKDTSENKLMSVKEISEIAKLDFGEVNVCIGQLKRKVAIEIVKKDDLNVYITKNGKSILEKESLEEKFLKKKFPVNLSALEPEENFAFSELLKRKQIVKKDVKKNKYINLTELGIKAVDSIDKIKIVDEIGKITPEMLKTGSWKKSGFRAYDIKSQTPTITPGKRHFVNQAIDYIKQIWLDLGFIEMNGDDVHTAFWDLDSLYVPQDHPAREMQDTFYIKNPSRGSFPKHPKDFAKNVKAVHEDGGMTDSKGWQYKFDDDISKQLLLRTHTTVLSIMKISELKLEDLPLKFFSVGKVYRNEALDWKHLFEFHQVEGIVIDPNANLKHLKGYLKQFYEKMGYSDVRMRPAHFPYTEPSVEVEVLDPKRNEWIELGGAGIFRPEVVEHVFGIKVPVLAWGQGMERIIKTYFEISDIRDLYNNNLKKINDMKFWMRS
jgi:phenylalanyl-tRNA synthetase alpha chain